MLLGDSVLTDYNGRREISLLEGEKALTLRFGLVNLHGSGIVLDTRMTMKR